MPDYKKMYFTLFAQLSETIEQLQAIPLKTEELYMNSTDIPLQPIPKAEESPPQSMDVPSEP